MKTAVNSFSPSQLLEFKKFGGWINKLGLNFAVCDVSGELVLLCEGSEFHSDTQHLIGIGQQLFNQYNETPNRAMQTMPNSNGSDIAGVNAFQPDIKNKVLAVVLRLK